MQKVIPFIKGHKKAFWGIYLVLGIWIYAELYLGESFFYTTVYTYSLTGVISYFIVKRLNVSANVSVAWFTLLIALFAASLPYGILSGTRLVTESRTGMFIYLPTGISNMRTCGYDT